MDNVGVAACESDAAPDSDAASDSDDSESLEINHFIDNQIDMSSYFDDIFCCLLVPCTMLSGIYTAHY